MSQGIKKKKNTQPSQAVVYGLIYSMQGVAVVAVLFFILLHKVELLHVIHDWRI